MTALALAGVLTFALVSGARPASAEDAGGKAGGGMAAAGEALFYPCTSCHPVVLGDDGKPSRPLPNGFERHQVRLVVHDKLGRGDKACLNCHDDPAKDPGKLKLIDGSLVDITGDVSRVCYRCHSEKYEEFEARIHGKGLPKCTSSGCHDPHSPSFIYADPLPPFVGTGFQVRAVSERTPFTPLAPAPEDPPVHVPAWFAVAVALGLLTAAGAAAFVITGGPKR